MTERETQPSAKIINFPQRGRAAEREIMQRKAGSGGVRPLSAGYSKAGLSNAGVATAGMATVSFGSGWYHEAAVLDAAKDEPSRT